MHPIQVIIAEDHEPSRKILKRFVEPLEDFRILDTAADGEDLVQKVMRLKPQLVLADIRMPRMDGVNAVRHCLRLKPDLAFVFITAYDDHAVEAFNLFATDYVMKPVERTRLYLALERAKRFLECQSTQKEKRNVLSIQYKHTYYYIPFEDIYFIERMNRKCVIHTREQQYQTYDTLENIKKSLDSSFYQCHRSYIVHAKKIHRISTMGSTYVAHFQHYDHIAYIAKQHIGGLLKAIEGTSAKSG